MIKQAIIPLAGLGTRMLPLTSVMPKELMPINGKPNLQYILEECIDAGVKEFIFIISKKNFFYDYHSKYSSNGSLHILPAKIPNTIYNKVIKWAKLAHELLCCSGISRSDFRYDDSKGTLYMLEINTQPGMTKTSLSPEQAKYCGISLTELVEKLISKAKFEKV